MPEDKTSPAASRPSEITEVEPAWTPTSNLATASAAPALILTRAIRRPTRSSVLMTARAPSASIRFEDNAGKSSNPERTDHKGEGFLAALMDTADKWDSKACWTSFNRC